MIFIKFCILQDFFYNKSANPNKKVSNLSF